MSEARSGTLPRVRAAASHPVTITGGSLGAAGGIFLLALQQGWITVGTAPPVAAATHAPVERVVTLEAHVAATDKAVDAARAAVVVADGKASEALRLIGEQRAPLGALLCAGAGGKTKERRCRWRSRAGVPLDDLDGLMDALDDRR